MMDAVMWAVVIGFLFGTVNGALPNQGFLSFVIGSALCAGAMILADGILVKSWLTITL